MSHINFECFIGMVVICLFQMGSGYFLLGGDGDLGLSPTWEADPESLLLGGAF